MPERAAIALAYAACCVLWGSTWLMVKMGLRDLPPLRFVGVRMVVAVLLLTPLALRTGLGRVDARGWRMIVFTGVTQIAIPYGLMTAGQQWIPSALSAVLFATFPVWITLAARVLMAEPLTARKGLACALGFAGMVVLELPDLRAQTLGTHTALGGALILAGAVVCAFASALVKKHLGAAPPLLITWGQLSTGAAFLVLAALALEGDRQAHWTPRAIAIIAYLAVFGTTLTYLCLYWLMPRIPVVAVGAIPLVDTTVALLLGAVFLREPLSLRLGAGGALVLGAAALANLDRSSPAPRGKTSGSDVVPGLSGDLGKRL